MERQQSLFFAAALPNSLTSAEPDPPAIEIEIIIKGIILADRSQGRGFRPFVRNLVQIQPSLVLVERYISFTPRWREACPQDSRAFELKPGLNGTTGNFFVLQPTRKECTILCYKYRICQGISTTRA